MKKKMLGKMMATLLAALLTATMIVGCAKKETKTSEIITDTDPVNLNPVDSETPKLPDAQPDTPDVSEDPANPVEPGSGRADGERFEETIILEGMEETVVYEHAINDTLKFEIDFECEDMVRKSGSDIESFVSVWDTPDSPENYLTVTYDANDIDTVIENTKASLSEKYTIDDVSTRTLDKAGDCKFIDASIDKNTGGSADFMQGVYFVPAKNGGTFVCTAHYAIEASEGFGRRFRYMMDSFIPLR